MKKKHTLRNVIILILLLALAGGAYLYFNRTEKASISYRQETARTADMTTYYSFSGNIAPGDYKYMTGTEAGTISSWLVEEGAEVKKDDTIARAKNGTRYKAPMDGTVTDIYVNADEDFRAGDNLCRIADYAHPVINITVDEYDVGALNKGDEVQITVQATGDVIKGRISRIAREGSVSSDVAYFPIEISLDSDGNMIMGLTCELKIIRQQALGATTLSADAIQYDGRGMPFVFVAGKEDGAIEQRQVTIGINNGKTCEITSGLRTGETVYVPSVASASSFFSMMTSGRSGMMNSMGFSTNNRNSGGSNRPTGSGSGSGNGRNGSGR